MNSGDLILWRRARGNILCTVLEVIEREATEQMDRITIVRALTSMGERCTIPISDHYDLAVVEELLEVRSPELAHV